MKQNRLSRFSRVCFLFVFYIVTLISCSWQHSDTLSTVYRNTVLIIGDGMGSEQVLAAGYYQNGQAGQLSFEQFPYQTTMTTYSASSEVTDSEASATAMATGQKVSNGTLSQDPLGSDLKTILEIAREEGKMTGLVGESDYPDS